MKALPFKLGTSCLTGVPRIQVCRQQTTVLIRIACQLEVFGIKTPGTTQVRIAYYSTSFFISVNPCGNFSDTSSLKFQGSKGSIGHDFSVCIHTENPNQVSFYPFVLHEISVLIELTLGHLRYCLTDVPPQPNSPPDYVFNLDQTAWALNARRGIRHST